MRYLWLTAVMLMALAGCAQDLPLKPYSYVEGFEGKAPDVTLWASRGEPGAVTFLGVTDEKAFEGTKSLKLDVTFGDSPYYYYGVQMRVPASGKVTMSARLWIAEGNTANVGFGANMIYPPTSHSGCSSFDSLSKPTGDWKLIKMDLVEWGKLGAEGVLQRYTQGVEAKDVAIMLDRWAIFLTGGPGSHAIAYLDDVRIEGEVPAEADYLAQAQTRFGAARGAFRDQVKQWEQELAQALQAAAGAEALTADAPRFAETYATSKNRTRELLDKFTKDGYASSSEIAELKAHTGLLQHLPDNLRAIREAKAAGRTFLVYPRSRTISAARGPNSDPLLSSVAGATLEASACAGEYEPVSALVYALQDVKGMALTCSALKGKGATIPATDVDIRIVKSWYQGASNNIGYVPQKWLIPELLLKDDKLVRVDVENQTNYLRSTSVDGKEEYLVASDRDSSNLENVRPIDNEKLQPLDLAAGDSREYWIVVHVPENAAPGTYEGQLTLASTTGKATLPLKLTIHPFKLQPSRLIYSIYYRATLSEDGKPYIDSERRSEQQYRAEMEDMKAHGVIYPSNYLGRDEQRLTRQMQIRKDVGLPTDHFYNLGYSVGQQTEAQLPTLRENVKWWLDYLKPWGYTDVYFYGIDEATGEQLERQKAAWKATQETGGKTFVACYKKTFEAMGNLLNIAVLAGKPDVEEAAKYHSVGSQAFCYANPQVGVEDPAVYRRNFGLVLWRAGFDGAMDYAYQHGFTHVWNDFDDKSYRDHNFTYPTVDGVVPTIAWEGFREAVDDVRYVTTLEKAIAAAPAGKKRTADEAQKWLDQLDPETVDLDEARLKMAEWVGKLR